ncbi:MAG: hypothetical protein IPM59_02485 [Chloracidobacterium sp.]|nr:hypothetical protein [Chloracidobacterium sp.]
MYVRFDAVQGEPLAVSPKPDLSKKVVGLWDRDVCEIFIAPDKNDANKYFEFEIAPTGEWIDLGIEVTPNGRKTDLEYRSGMTSAARIEKGRVVMAIKNTLRRSRTAACKWHRLARQSLPARRLRSKTRLPRLAPHQNTQTKLPRPRSLRQTPLQKITAPASL